MYMLSVLFQTLVAVAGGVVVALAICWLFWTIFKLVRHPEWGPLAALLAGLLTLGDQISSSHFLQIAFLLSGLFAAGCWWEGSAWRARRAGLLIPPYPMPDT